MKLPKNSSAPPIIPVWCKEIAESVVKTYGPDEAMIIGAFAAALHSERERCARAAEHYMVARNARRARELTTHEVFEVKIFARLIAAAIRGGHQ